MILVKRNVEGFSLVLKVGNQMESKDDSQLKLYFRFFFGLPPLF